MTKHAKMTAAEGPRSGTLNMRIDPKLKYLAEKLAKYQQRSLSNFIEGAIRRALTDVEHEEPNYGGGVPSPKEQKPMWGEGLWDDDEAKRFYNLATNYPRLLNPAQKGLWTLLSGSILKNHGKLSRELLVKYYNDPAIDRKHLTITDATEGK
jgi:hypothetical protein